MYSELPEDIFEELNNLPNGAHHGNKLVGVFPVSYTHLTLPTKA